MGPGKRLVLVADRDRHSSDELAGLLAQLGFSATTAVTGAEALAVARNDLPTLVVIDVDLARPSAFEVCRELREEFGETLPIVFVSAGGASEQAELACLLLGGDEYFEKPLASDLFLAKVRRLVARSSGLGNRSTLTRREQEVLRLLVEGRRRTEIAELLCITPKTASTHIDRILAKLGAHSQAQAVAFAVRDNVLALSA